MENNPKKLKVMKKLGLLLLNVIFILCVSCNSKPADGSKPTATANPDAVEQIKQEIEMSNSKCPIYLGMGNEVVLEGLSYENNTVTYNYGVAKINSGFNGNVEAMKKSMVLMLKAEAGMNPNTKRFLQNILTAGGKVVYSYHASDGESLSLVFTDKELKEILD